MKAVLKRNRIEIEGYDLTPGEQPIECEAEIKDNVLHIKLPVERARTSEEDGWLRFLVESSLMKQEEAYKKRHIRTDFPLIKIKGKPLSQTIIEDRE